MGKATYTWTYILIVFGAECPKPERTFKEALI